MRIALGIVLSALALILGSNLWAVARTPRHLRRLLTNKRELTLILDFLGRDRLDAEAQIVQPTLGSYGTNIQLATVAHFKALRSMRNMLVLFVVGILVASYLVSPVALLLVVGLLLLPGVRDLPASAKNLNASHVHTLLVNIKKWDAEAPMECAAFCADARADLASVRDTLLSWQSQRDGERVGDRAALDLGSG